jgi:hypothetical protein
MSGIQMLLAAGAGAVTIPAELGTQYTYNTGGAPITCSICKTNDSSKFIIAYKEYSTRDIKAQVLTVSGTVISFGSPFTICNPNNSGRQNPSIVWDSTYNKAYVVVTDSSQSYNLGIYVLTVSGTSLSKGSLQVVETSSNYTVIEQVGQGIWYNTAQSRWMVYYKNTSPYLFAKSFTSNGTTLSFSSQANLGIGTNYGDFSIYHVDAYNTTYVGWVTYNGGTGYYAYRVQPVTLSGTTFTVGTDYVINSRISNRSELQSMIYQPATNQLINFYKDEASNTQKVVPLTPSFGALSVGTVTSLSVGNAAPLEGIYDEFSGNPMALAILYNGSYNTYLLQFRASGGVVTDQIELANFNPSYTAFGQICYAADTVNNRTIIAYSSVPGGGTNALYVRSIRGQKN